MHSNCTQGAAGCTFARVTSWLITDSQWAENSGTRIWTHEHKGGIVTGSFTLVCLPCAQTIYLFLFYVWRYCLCDTSVRYSSTCVCSVLNCLSEVVPEQIWQPSHSGHLTLETFFFSSHTFFELLSPFPLAEAKRLKRVESKIFSLVSWTPGCINGSKAVCIKPRPSKPQILFF